MKTLEEFKPETQNAIKLFRENFWNKINELREDDHYKNDVGYIYNVMELLIKHLNFGAALSKQNKYYDDMLPFEEKVNSLFSGLGIASYLLFNNCAVEELQEAALFIIEQKHFFK